MRALFIGLSSILAATAFIIVTSYISAVNFGAEIEPQLRAARDDNKNILAQYQQKALEVAQVPAMYSEDFKNVVKSAVEGRYGPNGSQAVMQWIKESQINYDSSMYTKLVDVIQAGRKDFEIGQRRMIDIRARYETNLSYFWTGMWLRIAGFPKVNMADFNPITTNDVETTYQNGKESAPLKLR